VEFSHERGTPVSPAVKFLGLGTTHYDIGCYRKVDIRLPGKGNSNSHGARPVHQKHVRHDEVDPDKLVVNKEFSLSGAVIP